MLPTLGPLFLFLLLTLTKSALTASLQVLETPTTITLSNTHLSATLLKSLGSITNLTFQNQDLLGPLNLKDSTGLGPYLDCYCVPSGFYTIGSSNPSYRVIQGVDKTGTHYGGIVLSEVYKPTGQFFEQYWFLKDGETGLHLFSRMAYYNSSSPVMDRGLQEFRTLFRPSGSHSGGGLWTHLVSGGGEEERWAPLPGSEAVSKEVVVQDATWSFKKTPGDSYFKRFSEYFTKYTFSSSWRDNTAHGLYADGSTSNGTTFGAWMVMNSKDTYFGGPLHSDLTVDGIVYNYIVSNHHGATIPNITHGFDRTFGPHYHHFNTNGTLSQLRADAASYASNPYWNAEFYDSIAEHVANYVPSRSRGIFSAQITLPSKAEKPIAVLSKSGIGFQDNAVDTKAYQYWGDIDVSTGVVSIPRVKAGVYRLTVYASGVFGEFIIDDIVVSGEGETTHLAGLIWREESSGLESRELWRLGTPDKSSGEFLRGNQRDLTHPLQPREYWIYWGAYDFAKDFPEGVNFTIGESDESKDFNTVHWAIFGPTFNDDEVYTEHVNNWTINFFVADSDKLESYETATLTIQLAAAKTAAGNTDASDPKEKYSDLTLSVYVNDEESPLEFVIKYYQSSSCIVRSAVSCYQVAKKLRFPAGWLESGWNRLVLSLPFNATDDETAVLPSTVYVQYDALRMEIE